ncbi:MAG: leucine--tRNA ligase [Planctomycetota bacterium]
MAYNHTTVEQKWQAYWDEHGTDAALDPEQANGAPGVYVLDMFPYPSGAGLHVGHVENYAATDIYSRYLRMRGYNVMHPTGFDAFGLPAEQYAIKTGNHPAEFTQKNIQHFIAQTKRVGFSYDWDRVVDTTEPKYFKWTQWMFLQLYNSYFDPIDNKAKPIEELRNALLADNLVIAPDGSLVENPTQEGMEAISGVGHLFTRFTELPEDQQRTVIDDHRLAYIAEVPVNWCPKLGTVLANEEVIDGKSEVGGFPVERRPLKQWMLRITAYADRLLSDLDTLEWSESLKTMQREWIGRSEGAVVDFDVAGERPDGATISVFTTRPDTLFGATYMVLAPEHPLVDRITTPEQKAAVDAYVKEAAGKSERDRQTETKTKTGVFTGVHAVNPVNGHEIPIYVADYVLMGYGTGAIMAVPAHDQRDFEFATQFELPIVQVVKAPDNFDAATAAYTGDGVAINSQFLNGKTVDAAKSAMIDWLEENDHGRRRVQYKLRDWLFSRQRYWGEPFPIVYDELGNHHALPESHLPVELPTLEDFEPTGDPAGPLVKAKDWLDVEIDGKTYRRETNTMPQWAGSCWYYLRFLDPHNDETFATKEKQDYWMPVDLYVGGVEHAVLHLLYARFWHKVLFDLGHVTTAEPFKRLVNQGLILGEMEYHRFDVSVDELKDVKEEASDGGKQFVGYRKDNGERMIATRIDADDVDKVGSDHVLKSDPNHKIDARSFKMSKSRGNVADPDVIIREYGADALRLYVMYLGPLEQQKPWNTRDIIGMTRFLRSVHRNLVGDEENNVTATIEKTDVPDELDRQLHKATAKVQDDLEHLRFNTAIAELIKLNNAFGKLDVIPHAAAERFVKLLAPFAPHLAEELYRALGFTETVTRAPWPSYDKAKLKDASIEIPVQVLGKLRDKITIDAEAGKDATLAAARGAEKVAPLLEGKTVVKEIYVPGRLVNFVVK